MQLKSILARFIVLAVVRSLSLVTNVVAFAPPQPNHQGKSTSTQLYFDFGSMVRNFGKKVKASHILIGPASSKSGRGMEQDAAQAKLLELKSEIANDADKFAAAAREYSSCPSTSKGGDLGEFGPGMMVGPFDKVCFEEAVGEVHGPVSTPFGEHLILIRERS